MKALTWQSRGKITCETVPDPRSSTSATSSSRSRPAPSAARSPPHGGSCRPWSAATSWATRPWARSSRSGVTTTSSRSATASWCPSPSAARVPPVQVGQLELLRAHQPEWQAAGRDLRYPLAGLFGFSHITGGYAGGQAEYLRGVLRQRRPHRGARRSHRRAGLFLSDIFPTAYQRPEHCEIGPEANVAIWGCGPVGVLAVKCCYLLGQARHRHRQRAQAPGARP